MIHALDHMHNLFHGMSMVTADRLDGNRHWVAAQSALQGGGAVGDILVSSDSTLGDDSGEAALAGAIRSSVRICRCTLHAVGKGEPASQTGTRTTSQISFAEIL